MAKGPMKPDTKRKLSETIKKQYINGRQVWSKGLNMTDPRIKKGIEKAQKTIKERGSFKLEKNPRWKGGIRAYKNLALRHYEM